MTVPDTRKSEVRFAVVMYGGVSLAIYMNGIAQELLRMVRATATKDANNQPRINFEDLDPVEAVYRKLAYWQPGSPGIDLAKVKNNHPLPRTFVIDIISGTSAGGINGIFLAKALANGQKIDGLKELWITEGDVTLLLNDSQSVKNTGLKQQKVPESLFNSRRMYQKLLKAFQVMDADSKEGCADSDALVREVDLFVTATDIRGLVLPIKLSDMAVYERKHRTVFHFAYEESDTDEPPWNDFNGKFNPMLAFAARSTSSFPFAFEPMRLCDIDEVLRTLKCDPDTFSGSSEWKRFFKNYPGKSEDGTIPYMNRPFGDGGYLDNKPFSYAIETIATKQTDYPVDRKLLYIEPVASHPENEHEKDGKPNALENTMAALLTLPRNETIREDIEKIIERNRLNDRINRIISNLERDKAEANWKPVYQQPESCRLSMLDFRDDVDPLWAKQTLNDEEWARLDLADMTRRKGPGYVAYQRLEIAAVTDDFGRLLARVAGFDENSASAMVFRDLVKAWRERSFVEYRKDKNSESKTLNAFIHAFDLTYPMRRLNFLHRQIDRFYQMDDPALSEEIRGVLQPGAPEAAIRKQSAPYDPSWLNLFRESLLLLKKQLNERISVLRRTGRELRSRFAPVPVTQSDGRDASKMNFQTPSPLYLDVAEMLEQLSACEEIRKRGDDKTGSNLRGAPSRREEKPYDHVIDYFLDKHHAAPPDGEKPVRSGEESGEIKARRILEAYPEVSRAFDAIGSTLREKLQSAIEQCDQLCRELLDPQNDGNDSASPDGAARAILGSYYHKYSNFDMVIFPILYGTGGGAGDDIDIIRICPEDAVSLIDEQKSGIHKLGGTSLGNFGAFMENRWRRNDIMWGQLDGAERLITSLTSDRELANELISEAHAAIIFETIASMGEKEGYDLLVEPFMRTASGLPDAENLTRFLVTLRRCAGKINHTGRPFVIKPFDEQKIRDHYLEKFSINKGLEPHSALKNAARATSITGKLLTGIAEEYQLTGRKYLSLITKAGRLMLWMVEAAVPRSMTNLIVMHWLKLLYLFETVLIVSSFVFADPAVRKFGIIALAVTLLINVGIAWFRRLFLLQRARKPVNKWLAISFVVLILLCGAILYNLLSGVIATLVWKMHSLYYFLKILAAWK